MFAARLATSACKPGLVPKVSCQFMCRSQGYASGQSGKTAIRRLRSKIITSETSTAAGEKAIIVGQGVVAGAALVSMGGLCYYGLGLSKEAGAIDRAALWPDIVKQRIRTTYTYFGASLGVTAASVVGLFRVPAVQRIVQKQGWMSLIATIAVMWGTGMYCRSLPYTEGFGKKKLAWLVHCGVVGAVISPMMMMGGPLLMRAAAYTAGMVGGLSALAVCAPSEKFLNMGGPLAMGLGVVFVSSISTWFFPPSTALGMGLYSVAVYGGLVLFGMFLLYDTQKIIKRAETTPVYAEQPYDPINNSIGIYMDTVNIFIRIASIIYGSKKR